MDHFLFLFISNFCPYSIFDTTNIFTISHGSWLLDGGDWTFYHSRSVELSNIIRLGRTIKIKPQGFGIIGFISAIYSFFEFLSHMY